MEVRVVMKGIWEERILSFAPEIIGTGFDAMGIERE